MPIPREVSRKLREILGTEAAETMVDWMDQRERHYEELRQETRADFAEVRQEIAALREETHVEFARIRQETQVEFAKVRQEMAAEFGKVWQAISDVRGEMRAGFAGVDARLAQLEARMADWKSEVLKWAMGFWIGSLLAIVGGLITLSRLSH